MNEVTVSEVGILTGPTGEARLTPIPARIARILIENGSTGVTHDALSIALWGVPASAPERSGIRTHIHRVRTALRLVGAEVRTLHGMGYRLEVPATTEVAA